MVVLRKIKSATLMETLVATVLIVLVFMISSMLLNSIFNNTVKYNTTAIKTHLSELEYLAKHEQIQLPYEDEFKGWDISIIKKDKKIYFEASHKENSKTISVVRK